MCSHRHGLQGTTNVWGRVLSTGAWAVVFLNTGAAAADITCDQACFSQMNMAAGTKLAVKDVWTGAASTITAGIDLASPMTLHAAVEVAIWQPIISTISRPVGVADYL